MSTLPNDTKSSVQTTNEPEEQSNNKPHPLLETIQFALIALIIVLPVRWFIAQPFIVSGASMEQTFHSGEYLIVDQLTYHLNDPQPGDVVVFRYPNNLSTFFIKRIIGTPGDVITIDGNVVTITNEEHPDGYVLDEPYISQMSPNTFLSEELGEREYFVMGDNRDNSSDSRVWGVLQAENIIGRAYLRLFPFNEIDYLPGSATLDGTSITTLSNQQ